MNLWYILSVQFNFLSEELPMKLNQYQRNAVLYLLQQQEELAKPVSFASALRMGVNEMQIQIIDYVSKCLVKAPFLTLSEVNMNGVSHRDVLNAIGSLTEFKKQLSLTEYAFSDWLVSQELCYSSSQKVTIPYLIYQMFFEEIVELHSNNDTLNSGLEVDLGAGFHYSSVSLFATSNVLVPVEDKDALSLAASLLSENYYVIEKDESKSSLIVQRIGTDAVKEIEVRCLSSELSKSTHGGIYIHDDIHLSDIKNKTYIHYPFGKLVELHHSKQASFFN